ncbi:hypothetical protein ACQZV8_09285 [Magnetococcales bacterium HHB-1]
MIKLLQSYQKIISTPLYAATALLLLLISLIGIIETLLKFFLLVLAPFTAYSFYLDHTGQEQPELIKKVHKKVASLMSYLRKRFSNLSFQKAVTSISN